jgi:hypothetical protein
MGHGVYVQRKHYVRVNRPKVVQRVQGMLMEAIVDDDDGGEEMVRERHAGRHAA